MKHEEITKDIIGAAIAVLNELKPGLDEKLYENALVIELVARGQVIRRQTTNYADDSDKGRAIREIREIREIRKAPSKLGSSS